MNRLNKHISDNFHQNSECAAVMQFSVSLLSGAFSVSQTWMLV